MKEMLEYWAKILASFNPLPAHRKVSGGNETVEEAWEKTGIYMKEAMDQAEEYLRRR